MLSNVLSTGTQCLHEPPYTQNLADHELENFVEIPLTLDISSHSISTERMIRDVDQVSTQTTSEEKRDGMLPCLTKNEL